MAEKWKRGQNFTSDEKYKLVKLLLERKNTILNKNTDCATNEAKLLAWTALTTSFNASGSNFRSKESLMKVWEKMRGESKVYHSMSRRNSSQTGGGPSVTKTDPILEPVCNILGRGCTEIEGVANSDSLVLKNEMAAEEKIDTKYADFSTDVCVKPKVTVNEQNKEQSQAMGSLCSSYKNINKKKEDAEDLKYALLIELDCKKQNYYNFIKSTRMT